MKAFLCVLLASLASAAETDLARTVLTEELQKRTGLTLPNVQFEIKKDEPDLGPEGYSLEVNSTIRIAARTERGLLYGVGALIRHLNWAPGKLPIPSPISIKSNPTSKIRGHQLGYRAAANSWDAWTVAQYDQYIRDLVLFGVNAIENIPFQDERVAPLMKISRREMNREISRICKKYNIEYWIWLPADFELKETHKREAFLKRFEEMVAETPQLDGVFVPGGDPGDNPPDLVMPFLADLAARTPAKIWLSLQGFRSEKEDYAYKWINDNRPKWLGGLVAGPSSPPAARSRERLPREYGLRLYPDLTHNKICQYQVPNLDQAIALTLGREAINPRPAEFTRIHNQFVGNSNGFISYSDGVHDDVNKIVFSALSWNPNQDPRSIMIDYARTYLSTEHAEAIADAILALERNWRGPLIDNGNVEATLLMWDKLAASLPKLNTNWRWQMLQLRAVYDTFVRRRQIHERTLEAQANAILLRKDLTADKAMDAALNTIGQWPRHTKLRDRIVDLCEQLFQSIGLQTSVTKYQASGTERGAVLDFVDYPLNNRYWLEDQFRTIRDLPTEEAKRTRLTAIATWESPGPGSFYDDLGNEGLSPHTEMDDRDEPMFWWLDQGMSRLRLSSQTTMWPKRLSYEGINPTARYTVKTGGQGKSLLSIDGKPVTGQKKDDFFEFEVPAEALADGRLELTWEIPKDESHLNWRQRSRLAEVWLLKKN